MRKRQRIISNYTVENPFSVLQLKHKRTLESREKCYAKPHNALENI